MPISDPNFVPGRFRHRFQVQEHQDIRTGSGADQDPINWVTLFTIWGDLKPARLLPRFSEALTAGAFRGQTWGIVYTRYRSDVGFGMRLTTTFAGEQHIYTVQNVTDVDNQHIMLEIHIKEIVK